MTIGSLWISKQYNVVRVISVTDMTVTIIPMSMNWNSFVKFLIHGITKRRNYRYQILNVVSVMRIGLIWIKVVMCVGCVWMRND